jgi:hypothetical protein
MERHLEMKRNMFGEMQPRNLEEMQEAINELDTDPAATNATVEFVDDEGELHGWSAEVRNNDDGEPVFMVYGYTTKASIVHDLIKLGIDAADIEAP